MQEAEGHSNKGTLAGRSEATNLLENDPVIFVTREDIDKASGKGKGKGRAKKIKAKEEEREKEKPAERCQKAQYSKFQETVKPQSLLLTQCLSLQSADRTRVTPNGALRYARSFMLQLFGRSGPTLTISLGPESTPSRTHSATEGQTRIRHCYAFPQGLPQTRTTQAPSSNLAQAPSLWAASHRPHLPQFAMGCIGCIHESTNPCLPSILQSTSK